MPDSPDHVAAIPQGVATSVRWPGTEASTHQTKIKPSFQRTLDDSNEGNGGLCTSRDGERDSHQSDDDEYEDMYFAILCAEKDDSLLATVGH